MSKLLEGLNDRQKEAVITTEGPLLVLAGAGSGKTTVLTRRVAHILEKDLAKPWEILAITFTNKAAKEMAERIESLVGEGISSQMWVKTFHSACLMILRRDIDKIGYSSNFNIYDTNDQKRLIKDCLKELNMNEDNYPVKSLLNAISSAKDEMTDPEKYARLHPDFRGEKYANVYRLYQKKLKDANAMDFDDLIFKTVELFRDNPDTLSYYQNKFRYILVDEYQDTNNMQYELTSMLAAKHKNICVVGDDDQSIYKFRGANIRNILDFEKQFPNAKNIKLEQNYRSTQNILSAANAVISNNIERKDKRLWTDKGDGDKIIIRTCEDQVDEAMYISREIDSLISQGYRYSDIAILYRTNAQTRVFEDNLSCPYRVLSGLRFYDTKEIKDILAYLRVIYNPNDDINLKRIINVPKRGIGQSTIDKIDALASTVGKSMFEIITDENYASALGRSYKNLTEFASVINNLKDSIDTLSVTELMERVYADTGYVMSLLAENTPESKGRIENLDEFKSKAKEYEDNVENPTFAGFLDNISLVSDVDNYDSEQDAIVLMTLHSAKGLEFPVVFMCGLEQGLFPGYQSMESEDDMAEERRLCYVGITRAKTKLYITYALQRIMYGKTESKIISDFVSEIPRELTERLNNTIKRPQRDSYSSSSFGFDDDYNMFSYSSSSKNSFSTASDVSSIIASTTFKASEAPKLSETYSKGERVSHKKFGEGMIVGVNEMDGDYQLEISFDNVGTRTLMASFAKLKKL